jgi:hypothetical protein
MRSSTVAKSKEKKRKGCLATAVTDALQLDSRNMFNVLLKPNKTHPSSPPTLHLSSTPTLHPFPCLPTLAHGVMDTSSSPPSAYVQLLPYPAEAASAGIYIPLFRLVRCTARQRRVFHSTSDVCVTTAADDRHVVADRALVCGCVPSHHLSFYFIFLSVQYCACTCSSLL